MGWSVLDHTGDLGLVVEHAGLEDLFAEALRGFTDCLTEVATVRCALRREIELSAGGLDLLLVDWLQEALFLFETEGLVFGGAEVEIGEKTPGPGVALRARATGEVFDSARHRLKVPIKAVTYHGLEVERCGEGWRAQVVFDV